MQQTFNGLLYDCEIVKCIPQKGTENDPSLAFCKGWNDYISMGISCVCCYDFLQNRYRIFLADNLDEFRLLIKEREHIIGFNSLAFDDRLCAANNIEIKTTYDLLLEVRSASGQPANYTPGLTRQGYSLNALALANLGYGKSGSGELAPRLWQQGKVGAVIDYCLTDVAISVELLRLGLEGKLKDPTNGTLLQLRPLVQDVSAKVPTVG